MSVLSVQKMTKIEIVFLVPREDMNVSARYKGGRELADGQR